MHPGCAAKAVKFVYLISKRHEVSYSNQCHPMCHSLDIFCAAFVDTTLFSKSRMLSTRDKAHVELLVLYNF